MLMTLQNQITRPGWFVDIFRVLRLPQTWDGYICKDRGESQMLLRAYFLLQEVSDETPTSDIQG